MAFPGLESRSQASSWQLLTRAEQMVAAPNLTAFFHTWDIFRMLIWEEASWETARRTPHGEVIWCLCHPARLSGIACLWNLSQQKQLALLKSGGNSLQSFDMIWDGGKGEVLKSDFGRRIACVTLLGTVTSLRPVDSLFRWHHFLSTVGTQGLEGFCRASILMRRPETGRRVGKSGQCNAVVLLWACRTFHHLSTSMSTSGNGGIAKWWGTLVFSFKQSWTQILSLCFTGCVIWSKLLNLYGPQFPQLRNGLIKVPPHRFLRLKWDEVCKVLVVQDWLIGQIPQRWELHYPSNSCYLGLLSAAKYCHLFILT